MRYALTAKSKNIMLPKRHGLLLLILVLFLSVAETLASEQVKINNVLDQSGSYYLHIVTLHGIVRQVQAPNPFTYLRLGERCHQRYTFTLQDETGSIEAIMPAACGPGMESPEVSEGESVFLEGQVFPPGEYPDRRLSPPGMRNQEKVQVVTKRVWRSGEK